MDMKTKKHFRTLANLKSYMVLPVIAAVIVAFSSCGNKNSEVPLTNVASPPPPKPPTMVGSDTTWVLVDELPIFPGGDEALLKYIAENVKYPDLAKEKGIQGRVVVRFCVTSKGGVTSCEIVKSVSPEIDAEALRVVNTLANFEPAKQGGKPVAVWYMLPITFTLK
jgi:protein TonB